VAPIVLMFQIRAVASVLSGFDGGWPPSNRNDGLLTIGQAWGTSWWISCCGGTGLAVVMAAGRGLTAWSLPVALPMILAPLVIAATSRRVPALDWLWSVRSEETPSPVMREWQVIYDNWTGPEHASIDGPFTSGGTADVLG
jgi:membrane glycosyltransferase